ncbi:MAG: DUF1573 domain-containing protein [Ferruginibacter sp.]
MNRLFTLIALSCLSLFVQAQEATKVSKPENDLKPITKESNAAAKVLEVKTAEDLQLKESEYDFGKIPQGKPVTHIFEVSNGGNESIKIDNVQASCGCTTPEWEREKVLKNGESTKITVGYNAAAEGPFTKSITITYNGNKSKQFLIKGEVWKTPATSAPENKAAGTLKELN